MNWDSIASIATSIGVLIAAWQLREARRVAQTTFEDSFDQQYRELSMKIPVDSLLGKETPENKISEAREVIYNYLDLCNEQISLRKKNRVNKKCWESWQEGIKDNLEKSAFQKVWAEVKAEAPETFTFLLLLEKKNFSSDPKKWIDMKFPKTSQIIQDIKNYLIPGISIGVLLLTILYSYGNIFAAKYEAKFGKSLFTQAENDCRIDNLTYLKESSNGNGKVYLFNLFQKKKKVSHLIICNESNVSIDMNNLILESACDFNKLKLNPKEFHISVKYEKLAELDIKNNIIVGTTLYPNSFVDNFDLTTKGIEYTKIFLNDLVPSKQVK